MSGDVGGDAAELRIDALGAIRVRLDGERVDAKMPAKGAALLVYIADNGGQVDRTKVASLLWSDQAEDQARANLRVALTRLRTPLGAVVRADRHQVWIDTKWSIDLAEPVAVEALVTRHPVYDELLDGWAERGASLFDEWLQGRREVVRGQRVDALKVRAQGCFDGGNWADAVRFARVLVDLEPWHEEGHRLLLEALARSEGRPAALSHFDRLERELAEEFGVFPEAETTAVIDRINAGDEPAADPRPSWLETRRWPTRLFGRRAELDELRAALEGRRFLSIVGPGGIGKTRLLAALASELHAEGSRVVYVSFDELPVPATESTAQVLAQTVLAELDIAIDQGIGAFATLRRTLDAGTVILCLDNVEVFSDIEISLIDLWRGCPDLCTVVTTRRHLDLISGFTLELRGLDTSGDASSRPAALELFQDRATRVQTEDDLNTALAVCRSVDGHPLAIELAAHSTATGSVQALVDVLAQGSALHTPANDLPERHRSLDSLVEASIARVSDAAQQALATMAMFAGDFDRADLVGLGIDADAVISELVGHSLVRVDGQWFSLHPLMKRFARARLTNENDRPSFRAAHAKAVVLDLMRENFSHGDPRWRRRAADIRLAIEQMTETADAETLRKPLIRYLGLLRTWGWNTVGTAAIEQALRRSDLTPMIRAELHRHAGEAMLHAGESDAALTELERGLGELGMKIASGRGRRAVWVTGQLTALMSSPLLPASRRARAAAAERARIMSLLGEVFYVSDRRAEMIMFGVGSLRAGRLSRDPQLMAAGDAALSITAQLAGSHRTSDRYRRRAAVRIDENHDDQDWFTAAETLGIMALIDASAGRSGDARRLIARATSAAAASGRTRYSGQLAILEALVDHFDAAPESAADGLDALEPSVRQTGFGRGMAWVHAARAEVALSLGALDVAHHRAVQALRNATESGGIEDEGRAHIVLGRLALLEGRDADAASHLAEATPGLRGGGAQAIQHSDAHAGAAVLASGLETLGYRSTPSGATMTKRFSRFVRAVPVAKTRLEHIADLHAAADRRPRSLHRL